MASQNEAGELSQEVLFQSAFDHAAIGMALVAPDGRWLKVNRSVCKITGYSEEELLRIRFQDITHPEDLDLDLRNLRKMLAGETTEYQMEKRYYRKDGEIVSVLHSVSLVRNDDGTPRFFISQLQDITARKLGEEKLAAADDEIRRLRKGLLKVCAWTKSIEVDGKWISIDDFLSHYLQLRLTHGMSEEAERNFGRRTPK